MPGRGRISFHSSPQNHQNHKVFRAFIVSSDLWPQSKTPIFIFRLKLCSSKTRRKTLQNLEEIMAISEKCLTVLIRQQSTGLFSLFN